MAGSPASASPSTSRRSRVSETAAQTQRAESRAHAACRRRCAAAATARQANSAQLVAAWYDNRRFIYSVLFYCSHNIHFYLIGQFEDISNCDLAQVKYLKLPSSLCAYSFFVESTREVTRSVVATDRTCGTLPIWQNHVRVTPRCERPLCCLLCFRLQSAVQFTLRLTGSHQLLTTYPRLLAYMPSARLIFVIRAVVCTDAMSP